MQESHLKKQEEGGRNKSFGERLRMLRDSKGLTQRELAQEIGVATSSLQRYEDGWFPKGDVIISIAQIFGCSTDFLLLGSTEVTRQPACEGGMIYVKKVNARLSAGNGSLETSGDINGWFAFREDWATVRGRPSSMVLMDVYGDSMEPDIHGGDMVLIDESKKELIAGAIYAVAIDHEILIKSIDKLPGKLVLRSKNPSYNPIEIDLSFEGQYVHIIGRVLWWCRESR